LRASIMPNCSIGGEVVSELLADRDALAEREGKLRQALRKHCVRGTECAECGKSWMFPFGEDYPEEHEIGCLAALGCDPDARRTD
jgi:hypothetical protein